MGITQRAELATGHPEVPGQKDVVDQGHRVVEPACPKVAGDGGANPREVGVGLLLTELIEREINLPCGPDLALLGCR